MAHVRSLKPIIHMGPPKTATTSLQDGVIPHLGRPYQIKPVWARDLARNPAFEPPRGVADDVIVSDELLGDFAMFPPQVIAGRLERVFSDAVVVLTYRDPLELFYSLFRQRLINGVRGAAMIFAEKKYWPSPNGPNAVFDIELQRFREEGRGFFSMIRFKTNRDIFVKKFDVEVLDFDLLRKKPQTFAGAFAEICGSRKIAPVLPHANKAESNLMEAALAEYGVATTSELYSHFLGFYNTPTITKDREDFIRSWSAAEKFEAFANSFRFRRQ
jgi:hypothetical protein